MNSLIRAAGLEGYEALGRSIGIDVEHELARVGLSLGQLSDPDRLLPYPAMIRLLENSASVARCPDFGLRLSQLQGLGMLGTLSVALRHAKTLGDALQLGSRYMFVHSPSIRFLVLPVEGDPANVDLAISIDLPDLPPCTQTLELCLGVMAECIRVLGQGRVRPTLAQLPHARCGPARNYAAAFGCESRFERLLAALRIPAASLGEPLAEHNPMLQQLAQNYLDQNFSAGTRCVADQVRSLVRRLLGTGETAQASIASALAMHPRTLQRHLKAEGSSFEEIIDSIRRERLLSLFSQAQAPSMAQVSAMLGYAEQAVLTRSCQRWFGLSPSALRKRALGKMP
ncbi:MAG: AraC family transcriptional regulator [Pseudomonadota bacterium]